MRKGLTTYGDVDFSLFLRKAFIKGAGYSDDALDRPIVGIIDTGSGFNPCHANMPQLIDAVKRGVLLSGCLPIPFPTISLHESFAAPTSMYLRNLMSMDTEEMLKAQPLDAVVMIGGCDKTVPAQLMGAASADVVPAFQLVVGPMVTGSHRGERVGACTDCRGYWAKHRAGLVDIEEIAQVSNELVPSVGTCGVMGTASTMACLSEAMGIAPLGSATAPANSSARLRIAEQTGKLAAQAARAGSASTPRTFLTRKSFENAITVLQAVGGSTNAVVHLLAIAGRLSGIDLTLADFDRIGRKTPLLVDLKPSGLNYMQDLHAAGGVVRLLSYLRPLLHLDAKTVTGSTLGEELDRFPLHDYPQGIVRPLSDPVFAAEALCVLTGNLAPQGCIIKQSAVLDRRLVRHRGRAVVFSSAADLAARIDAPDLDVDENSVLVLQNIGPVGHPGMPEAGYMPIPAKLARCGVKDIVRISDGRMSGTANGAIVLHVSPEAAVGGPLAVVRQGDFIELDVQARRLHLDIGKEEYDQRLADWKLSHGKGRLRVKGRGYRKLYKEHVLQAHKGADFDFLTADGGSDSTLG
ncbi:dihydroxy-acid and 6-phosphogluconate dehydratase [Acaromyces ingoldii]|uniref:dihydroxy-acid dehydratase n=1 Tax=Acaromyces ingoldii TaxID=215250 RepID=A0A316YPD9_9BASI|nr:dihydroxy-acid and 6-phosphogluconate dehydratase [Acaromyces ingoldii]PWN90896.1 dihydroxy-acid and 6-phosphogluconate dehydratase [Acaromyces ingoldii]